MSKPLLHYSPSLIDTLSHLRMKALRKKVWFCSLTEQERILTGLLIKHIKIVKNAALATTIARIMAKLIHAIIYSFLNKIEDLGRTVARAMAAGAFACGNKDALNWMQNASYIRYLGFMEYYNPLRKFLVVEGVRERLR
ncbi:MAG: hypothetical protein QXU32_02655 [Nitrososphaerales archaeon]